MSNITVFRDRFRKLPAKLAGIWFIENWLVSGKVDVPWEDDTVMDFWIEISVDPAVDGTGMVLTVKRLDPGSNDVFSDVLVEVHAPHEELWDISFKQCGRDKGDTWYRVVFNNKTGRFRQGEFEVIGNGHRGGKFTVTRPTRSYFARFPGRLREVAAAEQAALLADSKQAAAAVYAEQAAAVAPSPAGKRRGSTIRNADELKKVVNDAEVQRMSAEVVEYFKPAYNLLRILDSKAPNLSKVVPGSMKVSGLKVQRIVIRAWCSSACILSGSTV